jgi:nitrite reductase (NADH) small subunit
MIPENRWARITTAESVPLREGRAVRIGGVEIAIFNLGDRVLAIENRCPHQGGPLCDGIVSGTTVVCPLHGWRFDLESGAAVRSSLPACVTVFPARIEDGIISVNIAGGSRIEMEDAA